jgi:hypothetical protein
VIVPVLHRPAFLGTSILVLVFFVVRSGNCSDLPNLVAKGSTIRVKTLV